MSTAIPNWYMYHGDTAHSGYMGAGCRINSATVGQGLKLVHSLQLGGPVLSVPALVDGYAYVGIANSQHANARGGSFYKIELASGAIAAQFTWDIPLSERDTHGFTGMGCTPAVVGGKVYFSAFNGKLYCLDAGTLALAWVTDLRYADPLHRQPVNNDLGVPGAPVAAGWSSPVVANGKVYVGMGEGENPDLFGFVYCLDAQSGDVVWIFCTCQFVAGQNNAPNVLPQQVLRNPTPGFSAYDGEPVARGCSVWSSIAYDQELQQIYCATGNAQPDGHLPTPGYSNGLLALDAATGAFKGFFQVPADSSYRPSDIDIDIGGSPTIVTIAGQKVVAIGCKNGGFFLLDAATLQLLRWRQLLPYANNGDQLATVDPHTNDPEPNPRVSNETSNTTDAENYSGTYSTAAFDPATQRFFISIGGPNYHVLAPGIDHTTTPFMRALDASSLADSWPMDGSDPRRYLHAQPPMYANPAECGLSSPAAVNDVVFCTTSKTAIYAFAVQDGTLLWHDDIGEQTGGYNGGYGYCMGPAIWGDYVVAGALVYGRDGGVLNIYALSSAG